MSKLEILKYVVIKDLRNDKLYIENYENAFIRNFEKIIDSSNNKEFLIRNYPTAQDFTEMEDQ